MTLTSTSLFTDWRDYPPMPILPVLAGNICMQKSCPHIRDGYCPYWGQLESTLTTTADEIWQRKGYCYFYDPQ